MKYIFLILLSLNVHSSIKFYWLGVSTCIISDGKNTLAFDAFITRHSFSHMFFLNPIVSKKQTVDQWMSKAKVNKLDAIFINHSHVDHVVDIGNMAKYGKPKVYTTHNGEVIAKAQGVKKEQIIKHKHGDKFQIGDFLVTVLKGKHAIHFFDHVFLTGKLSEKDFGSSPTALDYKMDEGYGFLIEHSKGKILYWPSSNIPTDYDPFKELKDIKVLIQGIALRTSSQFVYEKIVNRVKPDVLIPVHYDGIFHNMNEGVKHLSGVELDEFLDVGKKMAPNVLYMLPKYGEELIFFNK